MELDDSPLCTCFPMEKIGYGLGHIFNDLCAAMWFSYTLFYMQVVLEMKSTTAGILLMLGQIVDSLATPVVGWAIDKTGHSRLWHLVGTLLVSIGFSLIFSLKPTTFSLLTVTYYVLVIMVFQIGWAIVQISHLSIIPKISRNHSHSSDLTAIRYTASVCCNIFVYLITLFILKNHDETENIGPADFYKFKEIALIITFIGLITSMLFYCGLLGTNETEYIMVRDESEDVNQLGNEHGEHFLKSVVTYYVSLMYMSSRLFITLNLIYIPLYIDERATLDSSQQEIIRQTIASVPLVCYLASFLTSIFLKFRTGRCNDKITYLTGSLIGCIASIWIGFGVSVNSNIELYVIALLLGMSGSSTMVSSLCLTANFVKTNGYGGGLVYSIVTFTDKLISGAVVLLVQNLQCTPRTDCPHYYENVLTYICGTVSLSGIVSLVLLKIHILKKSPRHI